MSNVVIPGPSQLQVRWSCRRCGFKDGLAKTKMPVFDGTPDGAIKLLLDQLRLYLVAKHYKNQHCVATPSDFDIYRWIPAPGDKLAGIL